jgi:hypothetical protein
MRARQLTPDDRIRILSYWTVDTTSRCPDTKRTEKAHEIWERDLTIP